jgi:hypothetical protein
LCVGRVWEVDECFISLFIKHIISLFPSKSVVVTFPGGVSEKKEEKKEIPQGFHPRIGRQKYSFVI